MAENLAPFASREIRRFSFQGKVDDRLDDPRAHEKESFRRCASGLGQSLPCPASSKTGHVRYASKAEESPLLVIFLCGLMGDAHDVISSQQPVERWHGAASGNLARTLSHRCARWAAASWHPPVRSPRSTLDCAHCRQAECSKVSCDQTVSPC